MLSVLDRRSGEYAKKEKALRLEFSFSRGAGCLFSCFGGEPAMRRLIVCEGVGVESMRWRERYVS